VKGEPVVDPPNPLIELPSEEMARFAVGIVGEKVKEGDALELRAHRLAAQGLIVGFDIQLDRPGAIGAVADDRRRDERPSEQATQQIARIFAAIERSSRKIPQRGLAAGRLIDSQEVWNDLLLEQHDERPVSAPRNGLPVGDRPAGEGTPKWTNVLQSAWSEETMSARLAGQLGRHARHLLGTCGYLMVRVPPHDNLSTALLATGMAGGVGLAVHAGPRQC